MTDHSAQRLVQSAEQVARRAHSGHRDKAGQDYIDHPRRVAHAVQQHGPTVVAIAWLHDVVEDTTWTLQDLADVFPREVVEAVDALTRRRGEGDGYYARVRANPLALVVKRADIDDNSDPRRLALLEGRVIVRLVRKYGHALDALDTE